MRLLFVFLSVFILVACQTTGEVREDATLEELDRYLDRALLSSHREVRVVHGFGSGRLRQAVRQHLRPHPAVGGFRPGRENEGGNGATVVSLNKS